jgi:hypothetical protein
VTIQKEKTQIQEQQQQYGETWCSEEEKEWA